MKFSLKDLIVVVVFCAFVAFCASRVGFDNGIFWFVFCVGAAMSAQFVWRGRNQRHRRLALWVTIPILLFSFLFLSFALFADAAFLSVVTIFLGRRTPPDVKTLSFSAMVCGAVSLLIGIAPGAGALQKLKHTRQEFPIVSLENRLAYEHLGRARYAPQNDIYSVSVSNRLDELDSQLSNANFRRHQLERIHDYEHELFIRSMGFGVGRMPPVVTGPAELPPLRDIRFDEAPTGDGAPYGGWRAFSWKGRSNSIENVHVVSRNDFFDPDSFGAVLEPKLKIIGFIPHALHYPPTASLEDRRAWSLDRLELVSLLKFDEPRVYVLDHLPRMDQLSGDNVPTRPLDAFESGALEKLWTAEDVVIDHEGNDYRMLGSLRAANQCLDCHSAKRGDLLGAFSYALHRPSTPDTD